MPLTAFLDEQTERLRAFLADPGGVLLELRAPPEQEVIVTRLLVGFAEGTDFLFLGVDHADDGATLLAHVESTLAGALAEAAPVFAAEGITFEPPAGPADLGGELRTAVFAELVARALTPFCEGIVLVLRAPAAPKLEPFAATLVRLVHALESGRVKLVVLGDERGPSLTVGAVPRPRLVTLVPAHGAPLAEGLRRALGAPLTRVVVVSVAAGAAPRPELYAAAPDGRDWVVVVDRIYFWKPISFYGEAARSVVWQCHTRRAAWDPAPPTAALLDEVQNPIGYADAESHFAAFVERVAEAAVPMGGRLIVALGPILEGPTVPPAEMAAFRSSLERLKEAAVSPRVAFVALTPAYAEPDATLQARAMRSQGFRLDANVLEMCLEAHVTRHDLPLRERQRCTSALASFAMNRGNPERGLELHVRAVELAAELGVPAELAAARYALGGALYQCAALGYALAEYTEAVEIAMGADNALLAAHALLGMGNCYLVGDQPDRALECYAPARTYFARLGNPLSEAHALTWCAEAHARAGRLDSAVDAFAEALRATDRADAVAPDAARSSRADVLQRLAQLYARAGLSAESEVYERQARALGAITAASPEP